MATSAQINEELLGGKLSCLQTSENSHRLNQIEKIRAHGVGDLVALPQLVVCGDQSTGKSSVLEGLTGIPFPRKEGLCTTFPTEIILRHTDGESVNYTASIRPHSSRTAEVQRRLSAYRKEVKDLSELPGIIQDVSRLLSIRGHAILSSDTQRQMSNRGSSQNEHGHAFAPDALRIEVTGPIGLYLSVVDLPGLISNPNEEQTEKDVEAVHGMVTSYLESSRTIILAVLQAGNDMANQSIIKLARKHDTLGLRTVGIITKPDLINKGTEAMLALTARNQGHIRFKLGFFLLKNPSPEELKGGFTPRERSILERNFFLSPPWEDQNLDLSRVGVDNLRAFLQALLDTHIERELPKVREEIREMLAVREFELRSLGDARPTTDLMRTFLTRLSMRFYELLQAALDGNYHSIDAAFFSASDESRLRARVQTLNTEFAASMRIFGHKINLLQPEFSEQKNGKVVESAVNSLLRRTELAEWVKQAHSRTRGKELPGSHNSALVEELFHEQSSPWLGIAESHVRNILVIVAEWASLAVERLYPETIMEARVSIILKEWLAVARIRALDELKKLIDDERRSPLTYNHYYTDNVQKSRIYTQRQAVQDAVLAKKDRLGKVHLDNDRDIESFVEAIGVSITADMDEQACNEAIRQLDAYYKVAMKTFVDNVARQVIERHIISPFPNAFCPISISQLPEEDVVRIGSESKKQVERRKKLTAQIQGLKKSLRDLQVSV